MVHCFMAKRKERSLHIDGYMWIYRNNKRIFEHRAVMEGLIGRSLTKYEVVHHKNGIRTDNNPENLVLMTRRQHSSMHRRMQGCKMKDFICEYCGEKFSIKESRYRSKIKHGENTRFCSRKCLWAFQKGKRSSKRQLGVAV